VDFLLSYLPAQIFDYLQYIGYAVITYIAFRIATTSLDTDNESSSVDKPFTFVQACLFQWINPKGVVMAVSGLTAFNITNNQGAPDILFSFAILCRIWLILGEQLQNSLDKNSQSLVQHMSCLA